MAHPFPLSESIWTPNRDLLVKKSCVESIHSLGAALWPQLHWRSQV